MSEFVKVAQLGDIPDPGKELFEVDDRLVVVFHVEGQYYCLDDVCTHDGGPLGEGQLDGYTIACSRHGAKFDVRDGTALTMPATESTVAHQVIVNDDSIWVKVTDEDDDSAGTVATTAATNATTGSSSVMAATSASAPSSPSKTSAESQSADVAAPGSGLSEDHILEGLKKVIDPELFVNIVDLGLIYAIDIQDRDDGRKHVTIDMTMTSPACPAGPQLISGAKNAVNQLGEVADVEVKIVMDPPWTPDKMTDDARDQLGIF